MKLTLFCTLACSTLPAQRPQAVAVPLGGEVALAGDLYLPDADPPFATVLKVTPYSREQERPLGAALGDAGYAALILSSRGKGGSGGKFLPFIDEIPDLERALDWAVAQPWCDGRIGLIGTSSSSYSAQLLASTGREEIKALINIAGLTDTGELFHPGGTFRLDTLYPWLHWNYLDKPLGATAGWDRRFAHRPVAERFGFEPALLERMAKGNVRTEGIAAPVLSITGWNDVVYRQSLALYAALARRDDGPYQRLVVGPWLHNQIGAGTSTAGELDFGEDAGIDRAELHGRVVRWFDRFVKGADNGIDDEPPVRYFVMDANYWLEAETWPPEDTVARRFFLGDAGSLGDAPAGAGSSAFAYDPENPVPTWGGVNSHIFGARAGPRDQRRFAGRDDVLTYATEPLGGELVLAGPMRVVLHASSTAVSTDFTAKLIVVRPDGYERVVEDGIVRITPTAQPLAGEFTIELGHTALEVPAGARLKLAISSSNFPKYDRNPNTGADPLQATEFEVARQRVFHGEAKPSRLVLTVAR